MNSLTSDKKIKQSSGSIQLLERIGYEFLRALNKGYDPNNKKEKGVLYIGEGIIPAFKKELVSKGFIDKDSEIRTGDQYDGLSIQIIKESFNIHISSIGE